MKKRMPASCCTDARDMVFMQALLPMEAAILPARERMRYGTLNMVPRAYDAGRRQGLQHAKI